jgi:hypothetical protein
VRLSNAKASRHVSGDMQLYAGSGVESSTFLIGIKRDQLSRKQTTSKKRLEAFLNNQWPRLSGAELPNFGLKGLEALRRKRRNTQTAGARGDFGLAHGAQRERQALNLRRL